MLLQLAKSEVIEAFNRLGKKLSQKQIDKFVGSSQARVVARMLKWKEIIRSKQMNDFGQSFYIYELIPEKKEMEIIVQSIS